MSAEKLKTAAIATAAVAAAAGMAQAADAAKLTAIDKVIKSIKEGDDETRGAAWQESWRYGAPIIPRLLELTGDENFEVARSAKRGIWVITRHTGRPGADNEKQAVVKALLAGLAAKPAVDVARELIWMLSEIAGDEAVDPVAALLENKDLREDARMVLQRLPGRASLAALRDGLKTAPEDFKINIAQSLRARGEEVAGYPCQKMVPTRQTSVKPLE